MDSKKNCWNDRYTCSAENCCRSETLKAESYSGAYAYSDGIDAENKCESELWITEIILDYEGRWRNIGEQDRIGKSEQQDVNPEIFQP